MSGSTPNRGTLGIFGRQPRLSDRVAQEIVETIISRGLAPGDALPPERELGEQFGVSRTVIREAVRALDARGLLEVRVGSRIRVAAVDPKTVQDAIWHFARTSRVDGRAIAALSDELEAGAARMAADRATEEDVDLISRAVDGAQGEGGEAAELAFCHAVLVASHNELLIVLAEAVRRLDPERRSPAGGASGRLAVADAIARRDPEAAERAMRARLGDPPASGTSGR